MTNEIAPEKLNARFAAAVTLSASAKIVATGFLTFSSFLITGFGAILGFTVGNIEKVEPLVSRASVKSALSLFLWALALHVVQRYLASIVAGNAASLKASRKIFSDDRKLDWKEYCDQIKMAMWRPARWLLSHWISKVSEGDVAIVSRLAIGLAQLQGLLAVAQAGFVGWAAYSLLNYLK